MTTVQRRALLLGAGFCVLAGLASAQPGPGPTRGGGPGFGRGMNDPASYLANLKTELGITSAQENAWTEYANTATGMVSQMQGMRATVFDSMQTATWQERQAMMNTMFAARDGAHQSVKMAAEKLLPALTPAQRAKAATSLPGLIGPGQGRGPGMGAGQGQGMGRGMMNNNPPPLGQPAQ